MSRKGDPAHQRGEFLLGSTHDDAEAQAHDVGTRAPGLAVSMSAADGNSATTSSPTGV